MDNIRKILEEKWQNIDGFSQGDNWAWPTATNLLAPGMDVLERAIWDILKFENITVLILNVSEIS